MLLSFVKGGLIMSHFANGLKRLRIERGLTQSALAKELNVTQNAIFNWENEKREPNLEMIRKIADYFNTSLVYLLDGKEEAKTPPKFIAYDENGNEIKDGKVPKFTEPSMSIEEAIAEAEADELERLQNAYKRLNRKGKIKAVERVEELTEVPRYTKPDHPAQK